MSSTRGALSVAGQFRMAITLPDGTITIHTIPKTPELDATKQKVIERFPTLSSADVNRLSYAILHHPDFTPTGENDDTVINETRRYMGAPRASYADRHAINEKTKMFDANRDYTGAIEYLTACITSYPGNSSSYLLRATYKKMLLNEDLNDSIECDLKMAQFMHKSLISFNHESTDLYSHTKRGYLLLCQQYENAYQEHINCNNQYTDAEKEASSLCFLRLLLQRVQKLADKDIPSLLIVLQIIDKVIQSMALASISLPFLADAITLCTKLTDNADPVDTITLRAQIQALLSVLDVATNQDKREEHKQIFIPPKLGEVQTSESYQASLLKRLADIYDLSALVTLSKQHDSAPEPTLKSQIATILAKFDKIKDSYLQTQIITANHHKLLNIYIKQAKKLSSEIEKSTPQKTTIDVISDISSEDEVSSRPNPIKPKSKGQAKRIKERKRREEKAKQEKEEKREAAKTKPASTITAATPIIIKPDPEDMRSAVEESIGFSVAGKKQKEPNVSTRLIHTVSKLTVIVQTAATPALKVPSAPTLKPPIPTASTVTTVTKDSTPQDLTPIAMASLSHALPSPQAAVDAPLKPTSLPAAPNDAKVEAPLPAVKPAAEKLFDSGHYQKRLKEEAELRLHYQRLCEQQHAALMAQVQPVPLALYPQTTYHVPTTVQINNFFIAPSPVPPQPASMHLPYAHNRHRLLPPPVQQPETVYPNGFIPYGTYPYRPKGKFG